MTTHVPHPNKITAKNVLVVDDGPVERLAAKSMLEKLGFSVTTADSGEQALTLLQQQFFDMVICDIQMPDMNGLMLLKTANTLPYPSPFIMSTTYDDVEHAVASMRAGAYGYLTKPMRKEQLRDTVAEAMAKYEADQTEIQKARQLVQLDSLTNLMNKNEFVRRLTERLDQPSSGAANGALLLVKITGLNHINHSYNRAEGNKVLQHAALSLSKQIRATDILGRFGGDMFSIYLDQVDHQGIAERAASIADTLEAVKLVLEGDAFSMSLVIGGACVEADMGTEDLLNRADFAIHLAREQHHARIHIYSEADEIHKRELSVQLNTLALIRTALDNPDRLVMYYQPIINLFNGKTSHYEALLRIMDEHGKPCNTGELVKTCEVFGLIGRLDRAVVSACLNDVKRLPQGTGVAINLSGKSIGDASLLHLIETQISELNIDPSRIIFELTETAAFYNLDEVRHFVSRIKGLGCRFALDDFGVGFSSFYYIKELDFDYLKLDGSFIKNLPKNLNDQVFVRAMVEISKVFDLRVIAEWVEDKETEELLREFSVSYGQGYYFGKPMPLALLSEKMST
ncbi:MAG: EAL domain-containing protein [Burkholderiaceae bacterium]